jgi:nucleoside-diphosphate-sugar epimerase
MAFGDEPPGGRIVIAGASGVIGTAAVERFARSERWEVIAVSRRRPVVAADCRFHHLVLDLTDREACVAALAGLPPVSHLAYAAASEAPGLAPGWRDPEVIARNGRLFANLLAPLAGTGALRHVSILQGAKAYGAHIHPVTVPLRESTARDDHANFYWLHEDLVRESGAEHGFSFTIWRPQVLMGTAPGAAMNPVAAIGAYAALCGRRGLSFSLPGDGETLLELVDADLMADALAWSAASPAAAGRTFNITNGDVFVLRHAWPALADSLALPDRGAPPPSFATFFAEPENHEAWRQLALEHGLIRTSLGELLGQSHHYLDLLNGSRIAAKTNPVLLSTIRLRQAGFAGCRDSLESLLGQLKRMADLKLLPQILRR